MNEQEVLNALTELRSHRRLVSILEDNKIKEVLETVADLAVAKTSLILSANQQDLDRMDPTNPKYDRLMLNAQRIQGIAADLRKVASLPSPLGRILENKDLSNGLSLEKVSVPLGMIGVVYESRPNVTFDVFSLGLKSGNLTVLKGSRDAHFSNLAIVQLILDVLKDFGLPPLVYLAPSERESLPHILSAVGLIDVIIPRGGQGLINFVRDHSKVPVIETGAGIVHTYVDESADLEKARAIVKNAKTRRVSVCNALDALLIHKNRLSDLPAIVDQLDREFGLEIFADEPAFNAISGRYDQKLLKQAEADHFGTEFLSMKMAIKTVSDLPEAMDHIERYSSKHSEAIIAEDSQVIETFFNGVDAAVVYANTSTAFTDGAQFGMGAEIGISTQKLHARGPMALQELTSYKWKVTGEGHVRPK